MALIKCKECGQMVSDKAAQCTRCGCPVERMVTCEDCGTNVREGITTCPNCGAPMPPSPPSYRRLTGSGAGYGGGVYSNFYGNSNDREQRVQQFLMINRKFFPPQNMEEIRQILLSLDSHKLQSFEYLTFKDPTTMIVISLLIGYLGVDRFMLGDMGIGVLKLLMILLCWLIIPALASFVWWIIDVVNIQDMTRQYNFQQFKETLNYM